MKVEPLPEQVPTSLRPDLEAEAFWTRFHRWARDMWVRTGGGTDKIEVNEAQSLRQPPRVTSLSQLNHFHIGDGAPDATWGQNGDFYFRKDGTSGTVLYHKESGSWAAIT